MFAVLNDPLGRLRIVGMMEGASFLVLLGIAMPLKYLAGLPLAVRVVGLDHGVLFLLYIPSLLEVAMAHRWSFSRVVAAFGAALVPFGTFVLDAKLRREEQTATQPSP